MGEKGLVGHIRRKRAQEKAKQPFERSLFDRINGLVIAYGLGQGFLRGLDDPLGEPLGKDVKLDAGKTKAAFDPPLFSLSSEEEYRVTMKIILQVNNPYLHFVSSPDEIVLCNALYRRNPRLGPETLARCHFESLLASELGKGDGSAGRKADLVQDGER